MSRDDLNLIIAVAGLLLAIVATWAAIYAVRRDRADLRVTTSDAAAGNRYITLVNVGLRPVRIERLLIRRSSPFRWLGSLTPIAGSVWEAAGSEAPLPVVVQPAQEIVLHYAPAEAWSLIGDHSFAVLVEDAAGRRYPVRDAPAVSAHLLPLPRDIN